MLLTIEHSVKVHVHPWVLGLELGEHVLHVRHDALYVYKVRVLAICPTTWMLLLMVSLAVHVCVCESLRRITTSLVARPSLLLLRVNIPLHEAFIGLLPPPGLLLSLTLIDISLMLVI